MEPQVPSDGRQLEAPREGCVDRLAYRLNQPHPKVVDDFCERTNWTSR